MNFINKRFTQKSRLLATLCLASCLGGIAYADAGIPPDINALPSKASTAKKSSVKKEKFNPLAVNADVAIKDNTKKEIVLPGVMRIEGERKQALDFSRARMISMTNGGSVSVYLSATEPNRIQLPFSNPHIIGTTDLVIDKRATSNNVYIGFKQGATRATQIFFESPEGGPVLGLQLIPKNIPAQTIIVEDAAPALTAAQSKANKSSDYITAVQSLMETVALGATPNGYAIVEMDIPAIAMNGLMIQLEKKLSHRDADIYVYQVTNPTSQMITVREAEFDGELVQAVSIYPTPLLKTNESTRAIVIAKKEQGGGQ
ncbi:MAG: type-F conjugative transfer system secretin TraK [Ottowia sp.]|nr:type-F conjugative transfer system secretin TraK [Ottowia sp.]